MLTFKRQQFRQSYGLAIKMGAVRPFSAHAQAQTQISHKVKQF